MDLSAINKIGKETELTKQPTFMLILGKALVCLNVGADTFIQILKANGISHDFKVIKREIEARSITLKPEAYLSIFRNDFQLKGIKGFTRLLAEKNDGFEIIISVEPFSLSQLEEVKTNLFKERQFKNLSLPSIPFTDFANAFKIGLQVLRQKLKNNGFEYINERWDLNQRVPLDIFLSYLKNENLPQSSFLDCALTKEQRGFFPSDDSEVIASEKPIQNNIQAQMNTSVSPLQKILFGSPGTGKSFQIVDAENSYFRQLIVNSQKPDLIKTVFHPEYTYGDFMGKLMPLTKDGKVEYRYYAGHFLQALGKAYLNIVRSYVEYNDKIEELKKDFRAEKGKKVSDYTEEEKQELQTKIAAINLPTPKNVLLVIDEINRGNSAAIFGTVFQLLDRDNSGWSSYPVKISELEYQKLLEETGFNIEAFKKDNGSTMTIIRFDEDEKQIDEKRFSEYLDAIFNTLEGDKKIDFKKREIKLPPNLSVIATMNTSDNSIYFMDSAFKRRWDWEFIDITSDEQKQKLNGISMEDGTNWSDFVDNINEYIKFYGSRIRKIEDKQIGYYFIKNKDGKIASDAIKNKLMFFLWDSIFSNDKKPIRDLLNKDVLTFGDFVKSHEDFVQGIKNKKWLSNVL